MTTSSDFVSNIYIRYEDEFLELDLASAKYVQGLSTVLLIMFGQATTATVTTTLLLPLYGAGKPVEKACWTNQDVQNLISVWGEKAIQSWWCREKN